MRGVSSGESSGVAYPRPIVAPRVLARERRAPSTRAPATVQGTARPHRSPWESQSYPPTRSGSGSLPRPTTGKEKALQDCAPWADSGLPRNVPPREKGAPSPQARRHHKTDPAQFLSLSDRRVRGLRLLWLRSRRLGQDHRPGSFRPALARRGARALQSRTGVQALQHAQECAGSVRVPARPRYGLHPIQPLTR